MNQDFAQTILVAKEKVENLYRTCQITEKGLKVSGNTGANGFCLFSDNVGKVMDPRYSLTYTLMDSLM